MRKVIYYLLTLNLLFLLFSCAGFRTTTGSHTRLLGGSELQPKPEDCYIEVYDFPPKREFIEVGIIEAKGMEGWKKYISKESIIQELKRQACLLGATAIYGVNISYEKGVEIKTELKTTSSFKCYGYGLDRHCYSMPETELEKKEEDYVYPTGKAVAIIFK